MTKVSSSRIIVKNLPKRIDEKRLSAHFSAKGSITDVKLMHTPSGVFRRFAFVGFSCPQEAAAAISYFHNSFIDTSRIEVYEARSVGDPDIPRAWSRHSSESSANIEAQKRREVEKLARRQAEAERVKMEVERKKSFLRSIYAADEEEDSELARFMTASRPKSKTRTWENDEDQIKSNIKPKKLKVVPVVNKKPGGEGLLLTKTHLTFSSDDEEKAETKELLGSSDDELYEEFIHKDLSSDEETKEECLEPPEEPENTSNQQPVNPDLINETARLFVRNLSYSCTEQDLRELFEPFGDLEEVHLSLSRETKKPKGFAYIKFVSQEAALKAFQQLDGFIFQGRLVHILPASSKPLKATTFATTYKDQKLVQQKADAGNSFNWNSWFVRSDTVLSSIANQLGVSKAEIMNPCSDNLAIRLATAETHLIADTKKSLEDEGIDLSVFDEPNKPNKSKTVIVVKNFPFETERQELVKLFGKFGPLGTLVFPPSKAIAIVEFLEPNDAKTAFRALAYSKFHNSPLFLEFAPDGILRGNSNSEKRVDDAKVVVADSVVVKSLDIDDSNVINDTLYVKNINFDTTESTLREVFSAVGPLKSVTIPRKRDPRKPTAGLLSMGFAFVQFIQPEHATLALDRLQGTLIDGHSVVLRRSSVVKGKNDSNTSKKKASSSKADSDNNTTLMIRNIPFEANEKEVRDLFRNFAQVKRVRVPRKFDGGHRGFGFVDFINSQEAKQAMHTLSHTHLYGRHLVIEWADKKDDQKQLEELRSKAARNALLTLQQTSEQPTIDEFE